MSNPITTPTSPEAWAPDQYVFDASAHVPDALVINNTIVCGKIEGDRPAIRVAYADDTEADFVAEGATIDETAPTLAEAVIRTAKIAQLIRLSNESYRQDGTPDELARSVRRALTAKLDQALLAQPAHTGDPDELAPATGLLHVDGTTAETVTTPDLDALVDLDAQVRAAGADPSAWIIAPATWAELRKLKASDGSAVTLLGAGTADAQQLLLGVPVIVSAAIPSGQGLLIDKGAVLSAVSDIHIAVDSSRYFDSDSVGVRATVRSGHTVPRPERIGRFTLNLD